MTTFQEENKSRIIQAMKDINAYSVDIKNVENGDTDMYKAARSYGIPKFMPIKSFATHTGEIVKGKKLDKALNHIADFWMNNSKAIRAEDDYASHVTEETKDLRLKQGLAYAESVRAGHIEDFTSQQRLNTYLTGDCIALLSK